jgi:hypothetical protein
MTTIINGTSNAITFPDSSVQNSAVVAPSAIGQIPFSTDGTSYTPTAKIVSGTAQNSTSGTSIDFTSIPSYVKRITVMFNGVSTNGTSDYLVKIGAGSITSSGYLASSSYMSSGVSTTGYTTGFGITNPSGATTVFQGNMVLALLSSSTNTWTASGVYAESDVSRSMVSGGGVSLSGTLDRVRITTVGGTDTFDAGSINILYE